MKKKEKTFGSNGGEKMPRKMSIEAIKFDLNILLSKLPDEEQKNGLKKNYRKEAIEPFRDTTTNSFFYNNL
jgi:hypothetical protein